MTVAIYDGKDWVYQYKGAAAPYVRKIGDTMSGPLTMDRAGYGGVIKSWDDNSADLMFIPRVAGAQVNSARLFHTPGSGWILEGAFTVGGKATLDSLVVSGATNTYGDITINKEPVASLAFTGASTGVYWYTNDRWLTSYNQGGHVGMANGNGVLQPLQVGTPANFDSAINYRYLYNFTGTNGFGTGKVGSGTLIHTFQVGALPYATGISVNYNISGGFAGAALSVLSIGLGATSGISGLQNFFPGQGTDCPSAKWVALTGGFKGTIPANAACDVQIIGYTNQGEGAYWTGMLNWTRWS